MLTTAIQFSHPVWNSWYVAREVKGTKNHNLQRLIKANISQSALAQMRQTKQTKHFNRFDIKNKEYENFVYHTIYRIN